MAIIYAMPFKCYHNASQNIFIRFNVNLVSFTTSKTEPGYYYKKLIASRVIERINFGS